MAELVERWRRIGLTGLFWLAQLAWAVGAAGASAATPVADEALDERVNRLTSELRCLVCQNQTVADSQAELAVQLKGVVRAQLQQGATDAQVLDFMVERYGEFVLYKPPLNRHTSLLWLGPLLLLVLGAGLLGFHWWNQRRRDDTDPADDRAAPTPEERT